MKNKSLNIIIYLLMAIIIGLLLYFLLSDKKVEMTSISLNEHNISLYTGDSRVLLATIEPADATDKTIEWKSDNPNIASVSDIGFIVANSSGETFVTVRSKDGKIFDKCLVKVEDRIIEKTLEIKETKLDINKNDVVQLNITVTPEEFIDSVEWTSSDDTIVTVENGKIKGITGGTATIKATLEDKVVSCQVTVFVPVEGISLNKTKASIKKGSNLSLTATINPSDSTNKNITWKSSNEKIVKVDASGNITGMGTGKATIEATIDGKKATCEVISTDYIITEDSKFAGDSTVASYNSETLKYRITRTTGDFVLVWVLDAYHQFNSALPELGKAFVGEELLKKEINKYGYQNKGLVATNAGFFWDGWGDTPCSPFIINKGNIIRDIENKNYKKNVYGVLGMTKDSELKTYKFQSNNYNKNVSSKNEMLNDGVRNSFTTVGAILSPTSMSSSGDVNNRTILCQVDKNNFVIYSGGKLSFFKIAKTLKNTYSCKIAYNLDGGGSRKLYYKTSSMTEAKKVFGGSRAVPDMMYFVEQ